ncbi:MAG: ABC transporter permease subunit [Thermoanaerobacteraceae bacterium]|nr:ABC transporter permease subunit [Thermoanaerobacteraceae bacterium]
MLHNFGILDKLCTEVVKDLDRKPLVALHSSGASTTQMLLYGILPQATPKFLTYRLYRWEVIIRTTIMVGFVGAGGPGQQFRLSMSWFHFTEITLLLVFYALLIFFVDLVSALLRRIVQ